MNRYRIEIKSKSQSEAQILKENIKLLGIDAKEVQITYCYYLFGDIEKSDAEFIADKILRDKVDEEFKINEKFPFSGFEVEIAYKPAVKDPTAESTEYILSEFGYNVKVRRTKRYCIKGITEKEFTEIKKRLLYNDLIEEEVKDVQILTPPDYKFELIQIPLLECKDLKDLSEKMALFLSEKEMKVIQDYFREKGRNPTDAELETFGAIWSEHCSHKTLKARVKYGDKKFENLLRDTIMKATEELKKDYILSAFSDNAGVYEFDEKWGIAFKVETHNHPSALEPYGGASTGIGGVIRDVLGCGLGATPIANTDVFCFAPPDISYSELPQGVLHPLRIAKGVVAGVRDYGNKMGIPTVNGAVIYDKRYIGNPVVYCGCIGLIPKDKIKKKTNPGDYIVLVGGLTGKDGIHGATFSSTGLTSESQDKFIAAVQIGDPITEKRLRDALIEARDKNLYTNITDCGAGGICVAVTEMARDTGAEVQLNKVPLKYKGLTYREIWVSESQERMILGCPPQNLQKLKEIFEKYGVKATPIGRFRNDKRLIVKYEDKVVVDMDVDFIFKKQPKFEFEFEERKIEEKEVDLPEFDVKEVLLKVLSDYNIRSKGWIVHQYDHEVQGGTVIKPLLGDAAVIKPLLNVDKGIAIGCGINPFYSRNPYRMAFCCVEEAIRNVVAVGGDPQKVALLDNFSWGKPEGEKMQAIIEVCMALYDTSKEFSAPFFAGKDSLNNEFEVDGKRISIPHTLLISAITIVPDVKKAVDCIFKKEGNPIYLLGITRDELGGSVLHRILGIDEGVTPCVYPSESKKIFQSLHCAIKEGLVLSCHDLSDGGLAVALCEMCICGWHQHIKPLGAKIDLWSILVDGNLTFEKILFSESQGRFLVEVDRDKEKEFLDIMSGVPLSRIGVVTSKDYVEIGELKISLSELIRSYF